MFFIEVKMLKSFKDYKAKLHKLVYTPVAKSRIKVSIGDYFLGDSVRYYTLLNEYERTLSGPNTYALKITEIDGDNFKYASEVLVQRTTHIEWLPLVKKETYSNLDELKYEIYCQHLNRLILFKLFTHISAEL